jgi:hypothetical protein
MEMRLGTTHPPQTSMLDQTTRSSPLVTRGPSLQQHCLQQQQQQQQPLPAWPAHATPSSMKCSRLQHCPNNLQPKTPSICKHTGVK